MNQHDPLDGLYAAQAPKESLFQLYGKKVIGGIACSAFVAFIMHLPYIKTVILWLCTAVVMVFGKPATFEKIEGKLDHFVEKGREVAEKHRRSFRVAGEESTRAGGRPGQGSRRRQEDGRKTSRKRPRTA